MEENKSSSQTNLLKFGLDKTTSVQLIIKWNETTVCSAAKANSDLAL
jgi:hypothetical protein